MRLLVDIIAIVLGVLAVAFALVLIVTPNLGPIEVLVLLALIAGAITWLVRRRLHTERAPQTS